MLVVIAIIGILAGMLSGPLMRARMQAQLISCTNNLKQIGSAIVQYESPMQYDDAPSCKTDKPHAYNATAATTSANLAILFSSGAIDNGAIFKCAAAGNPDVDPAKITKDDTTTNLGDTPPTIGPDVTDATDAFDYNLTTKYQKSPAGNRIIVADTPGKTSAGASTTDWSIHDDNANWVNGAGCLFGDGHVKMEKKKCPEGSSNYTLKKDGNIYAADGDDLKNTFIQPTGTGKVKSGS